MKLSYWCRERKADSYDLHPLCVDTECRCRCHLTKLARAIKHVIEELPGTTLDRVNVRADS